MNPEVSKRIYECLALCSRAVLATSSKNIPHAAVISFSNDGFDIYFSSSPNSKKARNIKENNRVAIAMDQNVVPPNGIHQNVSSPRGIQIFGTAELLEKPEDIAKAKEVRITKFKGREVPPGMVWIKIRPTRIILLDRIGAPEKINVPDV